MDYGTRDYFVNISDGLKYEETVGWWDGFSATVAYNNMPLVEHIAEAYQFGSVERDPNFNPVPFIKPEHMQYSDELVRAKNEEHFRFLQMRVDDAIARRDTMSKAGVTSVLAGSLPDPLLFFSYAKVFQAGFKGLSYLDTARDFGKAGLAFGVASEARRAPFAIADEDGEAAQNIYMSTVFSAAAGPAFKGLSHSMPFARSTINKARKAVRDKDFKHIWSSNKAELDDTFTPADADAGDFQATQQNLLGSPIHKDVMADPDMPDFVKEIGSKMTNTGAITTHGNRKGKPTRSWANFIVPYEGMVNKLEIQLRDLHARSIGVGEKAKSFMGLYENPVKKLVRDESPFNDWYAGISYKRLALDDPNKGAALRRELSDIDLEAIALIDEHFKFMGKLGEDVGILNNDTKIVARIERLKKKYDKEAAKIASIETPTAKAGISTKQFELKQKLIKRQDFLKMRIDDLESYLEQSGRRFYKAPLYYDKNGKLLDVASREGLTDVFDKWYAQERVRFSEDPNIEFVTPSTSTREDAERTLARIMEEEEQSFEQIGGDIKALKHRNTNVPEWMVNDYIRHDFDVLHTYTKQMGKRIEFARLFDNEDIDGVLENMETRMRKERPKGVKAAQWEKKIAKARKAIAADFERVAGTFMHDADRWDAQVATVAKNYTGYVYLPLAGVSAVTDHGSIILAHGMKKYIDAGVSVLTDMEFTAQVFKQANFAGELMDMARGVQMRHIIDDSTRRLDPNKSQEIVQKGNSVFYLANALGPMTVAGKTLDQIIVQDKFLKLSRKLVKGDASKYDIEYLARYGIDENVAKYVADNPTSKHRSADFEFSDTNQWATNTKAEREALLRYRAGIAAHANNTIVYGQIFDKPLITNGVMYVKDNAFTASMRKRYPTLFAIDKRASTAKTKYIKLESQLMTLPFTFMNFAFGANNKILGAIRDPNRRHRIQGMIALAGLSYMSLQLKKPDWWFEGKTTPELLARVIDHSGMLGLYSDLGYMGAAMAAGSGLTDYEETMFKPKYNPTGLDAFLEPFGAPVGLMADYGKALKQFVDGDTEEGAETLFYAAPFIGLPYIQGDAKELLIGERYRGF